MDDLGVPLFQETFKMDTSDFLQCKIRKHFTLSNWEWLGLFTMVFTQWLVYKLGHRQVQNP